MPVIAKHPDQSLSLLAGLIRHQINEAEQIIEDCAEYANATLGNPTQVLSPAGNICDTALTNALWLRDAAEARILTPPEDLPHWFPEKSFDSAKAAVVYLDIYRDTDSPEQALQRLSIVNTLWSDTLENLPNDLAILNHTVSATFYGDMAFYQLLCKVIEHGQYHLGQAAGTAKSLRAGA